MSTTAPVATGSRPPVVRVGRPVRFGLLALGGVSLLAGLDAALLLLGLPAPVGGDHLPGLHGMLMVLGFLGTLIALERAVALRAGWGFLAPGLLGAGAVALLSPAPPVLGRLLLLHGCLVLAVLYVALWRRSREATVLVQLLGAVLAGCAALLWLRVEVFDLVPLLAGFVVLTIAAERVELARISVPDSAPRVLLGAAAGLSLAALLAVAWSPGGGHLFGAVLLGLVGYLLRNDVARRLVRSSGLPRFSAAALLAGYAWLALAAAVWLVVGRPAGAAAYDVVVHGTFLGFAVSMVMAHAPVILPAVLSVRLPYRPLLWVPLGVLHAGMVVRVLGLGVAGGVVWQLGSVVTVAAVLLLVVAALVLAVTA